MRTYRLQPKVQAGEGKTLAARTADASARVLAFGDERAQLESKPVLGQAARSEKVRRQEIAQQRRERSGRFAPLLDGDGEPLTLERRPHRAVAAKFYRLFDAAPTEAAPIPDEQLGPLFSGALRAALGSHGGHICETDIFSLLTPEERTKAASLSPLQTRRLAKQWTKNPWDVKRGEEGRRAKAILAADLEHAANEVATRAGWWLDSSLADAGPGEWRWPTGDAVRFERRKIWDDDEIKSMATSSVERDAESSNGKTPGAHPAHAGTHSPGDAGSNPASATNLRLVAEMEEERARRRLVHEFISLRDLASRQKSCGELVVHTVRPPLLDDAGNPVLDDAGNPVLQGAELVQHELGGVLADAQRCEWRFCNTCARRASARTRVRLAKALAAHGIDAHAGSTDSGKKLFLVTYTMRDLHNVGLAHPRAIHAAAWRLMTTSAKPFTVTLRSGDEWTGFFRAPTKTQADGTECNSPSLVVGGMAKDEFTYSTKKSRAKLAKEKLRQADELLCDPERPWSGDFERVAKLRDAAVRLESNDHRESYHYHSHTLLEPGELWPRRDDGSYSLAGGQDIALALWRHCLATVLRKREVARRMEAAYEAVAAAGGFKRASHERALRRMVRADVAECWTLPQMFDDDDRAADPEFFASLDADLAAQRCDDGKNGGVNVQIPRAGLMEVAKYIVKPLELTSYPTHVRREVIATLRGAQLVKRFGSWRGNAFADVFDDDDSRPLTEEEVAEVEADPRVAVAADLEAATAIDEDEEGRTVNTALTGSSDRRVGWVYGTERPVTRGELLPSSSPWHREQARKHFEVQWTLRQVRRVLSLVDERPHWPLRPPTERQEHE